MKKKKNGTRNWSDAPPEIIGLIAERLHSVEDLASFRGVCSSWRSASHCSNVSSRTLPWILFPPHSSCKKHTFWSLSLNKFYKLNLADDNGHVISSSRYGLLLLSGGRGKLEISNPLTHVSYPLPPLSTLEGFTCFHKLVLASSAKDHFLVFAILSHEIAFTGPGYKTWTAVNVPLAVYDDILHLGNQFYVINQSGLVMQFDVTNQYHSPTGIEFASPPTDIQCQAGDEHTFYLVEIMGKLYTVLHVNHYVGPGKYTHFFRVFKLDFGSRKWEEVFTLGNYAIFVGYTTSFSVLVSEHPELRSSIYFMGYYIGPRRHRNTAIFNLETSVLEPFDLNFDVPKFSCTAFWFLPDLS